MQQPSDNIPHDDQPRQNPLDEPPWSPELLDMIAQLGQVWLCHDQDDVDFLLRPDAGDFPALGIPLHHLHLLTPELVKPVQRIYIIQRPDDVLGDGFYARYGMKAKEHLEGVIDGTKTLYRVPLNEVVPTLAHLWSSPVVQEDRQRFQLELINLQQSGICEEITPKRRAKPSIAQYPRPRIVDDSTETEPDADDEQPPPPWPVLNKKALYGLAGDVVRTISPETEADPVAILVQTLVHFGNVIGRQPHCTAEADYHALNEFAVLVGATSKGRKGTSAGHVRGLFKRTAEPWTQPRIQMGLSSGEGLIWAVRDQIVKCEAVRDKHNPTGEYQDVVVDQGVSDKRLLVLEAEFASTLRVLGRDGNTLSAIIRQAWDAGDLKVLTKNSPAEATGAHISIIGHITRDELLRYLDSTESGNGFGNRILWCCVRRSKTLPEGGKLKDKDLGALARRLRKAIEACARVQEITRNHDARTIWRQVYPELSEGMPGLLGAMTSRAEAHVMRLSALYALLDGTAVVTADHLKAALALWEYCEASARFIFGDALGDPLADEILESLRENPKGLTRTEISNSLRHHKTAEQIKRALKLMAEQGLATWDEQKTEGRTAVIWRAIGGAKKAN